MISVVTVVNILTLLDFHILNATASLWRFIIQRWRFLQPDHQCVKTTKLNLGRGQEVGAGGEQTVLVLLESLIHSPFLFWYTKTPTTAPTTATTATPARKKTRM